MLDGPVNTSIYLESGLIINILIVVHWKLISGVLSNTESYVCRYPCKELRLQIGLHERLSYIEMSTQSV